MSIVAVTAVPAAPLLLPAASPAQPAELVDDVDALREQVLAALTALAGVGTVVLIAGGEAGVLHDRAVASLKPWGVDAPSVELGVETGLLAAVAARGRYPRGRTDQLDGDLAVLTLLCADAGLAGPVLPMEVPTTASATALGAVAAGLKGAADASDQDVAVVVAGDLSAGLDTSSPAYEIPGAHAYDRAVVAALGRADHETLAELGPAEAERVAARGWAGLVVADQLAADDPARRDVRYSTLRGVGRVVLRA